MPYDCPACGARFERFMRRPLRCQTHEACDLVFVEAAAVAAEPPTPAVTAPQATVHVSALTVFGDAAARARERLAREAVTPRMSLNGRSYVLRDGAVIGRQGDVATEELASDVSISRRHAELRLTAGGWQIRNLAISGSPLLIDGARLLPERERILSRGTYRVRLGDELELELDVP